MPEIDLKELESSVKTRPLTAADFNRVVELQHLGIEGYQELTRTTLDNADRMREGIAAIDGLQILGDGGFHLVAMTSDPDADDPVDVFALADALESATQPPNQIGVATHLVDLLADRPAGERQRLAGDIESEATRRKSEVLHCFALWVDGQPCGQGAPPWVVAEAAPAATPAPRRPARPPRPGPGTAPAAPRAACR